MILWGITYRYFFIDNEFPMIVIGKPFADCLLKLCTRLRIISITHVNYLFGLHQPHFDCVDDVSVNVGLFKIEVIGFVFVGHVVDVGFQAIRLP